VTSNNQSKGVVIEETVTETNNIMNFEWTRAKQN
jgi:hypothetical protein